MTADVLADRLDELADKERLAPRAAELHTLAQDLRQGTHLDQWAEVDLLRSYVRRESLAPDPFPGRSGRLAALVAYLRNTRPHDRSLGAFVRWLLLGLRQRPARDGVLEALLGVLVFVPLLVTWLGLREAVVAYGELSRDDPKAATRPFLQLWQSGFGGHLSTVGRFENVALTTVLLIVLLVLLAVWHARARSRAEDEEARLRSADEQLLGSLASLLTQTQFLLVTHRAVAPQQFGRELSRAAKQLGALTAQAERSHQSLAATGAVVRQATDELRAAALALTAEIPRIGGMADRLEEAVRASQEATVRAGRDNAAAAQGIADRIKAAGATVETALGTLASAQQTLAEKSEAVAEASERASKALLDSTARTNEAVDGIRDATERWDAAAAHWQDASERILAGLDGRPTHPAPGEPADAVPAPSSATTAVLPTVRTGHAPPHDTGPTAPTAPTVPAVSAPLPDTVPGPAPTAPDTGADGERP